MDKKKTKKDNTKAKKSKKVNKKEEIKPTLENNSEVKVEEIAPLEEEVSNQSENTIKEEETFNVIEQPKCEEDIRVIEEITITDGTETKELTAKNPEEFVKETITKVNEEIQKEKKKETNTNKKKYLTVDEVFGYTHMGIIYDY